MLTLRMANENEVVHVHCFMLTDASTQSLQNTSDYHGRSKSHEVVRVFYPLQKPQRRSFCLYSISFPELLIHLMNIDNQNR